MWKPLKYLLFGLLAIAASCTVIWILIQSGSFLARSFVPPNFEKPTARAGFFLLFACCNAGLTTAFVQVTRTLIPFRGWHLKKMLTRWLETGADTFSEKIGTDSDVQELMTTLGIVKVSPTAALEEIRQRESMRSRDQSPSKNTSDINLYDLPIEQLSGQLSLAIESAIEDPLRFKHLLLSLVGVSATKELLKLVTYVSYQSSTPRATLSESDAIAAAEARSNLARTSQLEIDGFQISAGGDWRRTLRVTIVLVSVTFGLTFLSGAVEIEKLDSLGSLASFMIYAILQGVVAAYISMLIRDLTAIVESRRRMT